MFLTQASATTFPIGLHDITPLGSIMWMFVRLAFEGVCTQTISHNIKSTTLNWIKLWQYISIVWVLWIQAEGLGFTLWLHSNHLYDLHLASTEASSKPHFWTCEANHHLEGSQCESTNIHKNARAQIVPAHHCIVMRNGFNIMADRHPSVYALQHNQLPFSSL